MLSALLNETCETTFYLHDEYGAPKLLTGAETQV